MSGMRPTYNPQKTWQENYRDGPEFSGSIPAIAEIEPAYDLCGLKLDLPFGVGAGLLWNARWIELYARLGFSILTTKTVRTRRVEGHPFPQVLAVADVISNEVSRTSPGRNLDSGYASEISRLGVPPLGMTDDGPTAVIAHADMTTLAHNPALVNSLGNPYVAPEIWVPDIARAKTSLSRGQMLVVSITGTVDPGAGLKEFADDCARCAWLALNAGADALEVNLSCPNVANPAENVYQNPAASAKVLAAVREVAAHKLLFVKVGRFPNSETARTFLAAVADKVDAITAINSEPVTVLDPHGAPAFPGRATAGLTGKPLKHLALAQVRMLAQIRRAEHYAFKIIGLGGVTTPQDFVEIREAGADAVESVTGAMVNPLLAREIAEWVRARVRPDELFGFNDDSVPQLLNKSANHSENVV